MSVTLKAGRSLRGGPLLTLFGFREKTPSTDKTLSVSKEITKTRGAVPQEAKTIYKDTSGIKSISASSSSDTFFSDSLSIFSTEPSESEPEIGTENVKEEENQGNSGSSSEESSSSLQDKSDSEQESSCQESCENNCADCSKYKQKIQKLQAKIEELKELLGNAK